MLLIVGLDRCRKPLVICRMALYTKVAVYITVRTCTHVYRKKTAPPPRIIYFTVTFSNHPLSKGLLEPWGFVCGHLHLPQTQGGNGIHCALAVVAVTATAAACVC